MKTKEEILKDFGIYPGFRYTYTYVGILSAMEVYAAQIAQNSMLCTVGTMTVPAADGYSEEKNAGAAEVTAAPKH